MEHILYWLWLTGLFGTEAGRLIPLIKRFGSIEELYRQKKYSDSGLNKKVLEKLNNKSLDWAKVALAACEKKGIKSIVFDSPEYPKSLRQIFIPPAVLYTKGQLPDWDNKLLIGVVGTRKATDYGINVTTQICEELSKRGVTIVSGFAKGIDAAATRCAVNYSAYSVSVCGCGLDIDYPKTNTALRAAVEENGLMISEYPPGHPPAKWTFPKRNRIIAGLCKGVLITEAPKSSGALITAQYALEENRDVFAVPGKIDDENSMGINDLIKSGAKPIFSADDILSEYEHYTKHLIPNTNKRQIVELPNTSTSFREKNNSVPKKPDKSEKAASKKRVEEKKTVEYKEITKTGTEGEILKLLTGQDMHIDELIRKTQAPLNQFNTAIIMLEISGDIKRLAGNIFHREK